MSRAKRLLLLLLVFPVLIALLVAPVAACKKPAATPTSKPIATAVPTPTPVPVKPIKLTIVNYMPEDFWLAKVNKWWADEVNKRTGGRVTAEFQYGGLLLKAGEVLEGVGKGIADSGLACPAYTPAQLPLTFVTHQVYVTPKVDAVMKAFLELVSTYQPLMDEYKKNNVRVLYTSTASYVTFNSTKPINTIADFKGMKIRAYGQGGDVLNLLGATAMSMASTDVYEALQRKVIDAATGLGFDLSSSYKLWEVSPYAVDTGMGNYLICPQVMNLDTWNKIPPDIQKVMDQVSREVEANYLEGQMNANLDAVKAWVAGGGKVMILPPEEVAKAKAIATPKIWDDWVKGVEAKGLPAREIFDKYIALVRKYEPQSTFKSPFEQYLAEFKK